MASHITPYGFGITVARSFADTVPRVRDALAAEGFGILSEIDVAATLEKKLGVDFRPYLILGACNPVLAHRALSAEPDIGLLLPCNVVVYAANDADTTIVSIMDPEAALGLTRRDDLAPLAAEVRTRLERALGALEASTTR